MIFKLTEEQVLEIIELYGGSKETINEIEIKLNLTGLVRLEEDYYELVAATVSQMMSVMEQIKNALDDDDRIRLSMSLDEIIDSELKRKYEIFEDEELETQIQLAKLYNNK